MSKDKEKLPFFTRVALKRLVKKMRKQLNKVTKLKDKMSDEILGIDEKISKKMAENREKVILSIIGDPENKIYGLVELFEVKDDEGRNIDRKMLDQYPIEDLIELYSDLLNEMEKQV